METHFEDINDDSSMTDSDDESESMHPLMSEPHHQKAQSVFHMEKTKPKSERLNLCKAVLLDSCSSANLFCNEKLARDIVPTKNECTVKGTGGQMVARNKAIYPVMRERVWYSPKAIANIASLKAVRKQYWVTYDSNKLKFVVHREKDGLPNLEFHEHESGLYYYYPQVDEDGMILVATVAENKLGYSKRQIAKAEEAQRIYRTLCYPSWQQFRQTVQLNNIKDCTITVNDIDAAMAIFGKDVAGLKGKTTRTKPKHVVGYRLKIPKEILDKHRNVYLTADIFFVNQVIFFLSYSRKINYTGVENLTDRKTQTIFQAFVAIYKVYRRRNFNCYNYICGRRVCRPQRENQSHARRSKSEPGSR